MEFKNESGLEFTDISSEESRVYTFPNGSVTVLGPTHLHVSKSGGHRIFSIDGLSRYIPSGWICLTWKAKRGQPNFVK